MELFQPTGLTVTSDNLVVYSSKVDSNSSDTISQAKIMVFDPANPKDDKGILHFKNKYTPQFPTKAVRSNYGPIIASSIPNTIVGISPMNPNNNGSNLDGVTVYSMDVSTGQLFYSKDIPNVGFANTMAGSFKVGPDGNGYIILETATGSKLYKIDLATGQASPLIMVEGLTTKSVYGYNYNRFVFHGNDVFLTGAGAYTNSLTLKRIRNIVPTCVY